jgi:hypothetical protein
MNDEYSQDNYVHELECGHEWDSPYFLPGGTVVICGMHGKTTVRYGCEMDGYAQYPFGEQYWHCDRLAVTKIDGRYMCERHAEDYAED